VFHFAGFELTGLQLCMVSVGVVMIFYSVIGGLWAAVLSDAVQGVIILVMSLLIFPISLNYVGNGGGLIAGMERLFSELPREYLIPQRPAREPRVHERLHRQRFPRLQRRLASRAALQQRFQRARREEDGASSARGSRSSVRCSGCCP
jgi:Na+(H+)/acetate symporter ActP